jgi:exonuclease III
MRHKQELPDFGTELDRINGNEATKRKFSWRKYGAVAAMATVLIGAKEGLKIYDRFNTSGIVEQYGSSKPKNDQVDSRIRLVTWNVANRTLELEPTIEKLAKANDAVLLQEVQESDIEILKEELPDSMSVVYGFADGKEHGGYGDAIVTEEPYSDSQSVSIKGSSTITYAAATVAGAGAGVAGIVRGEGFSLDRARQNETENREVLAITLKSRINGKVKEVRILDSHIGAGDPERPYKSASHLQQFRSLLEVIKRNVKDDRPTFVCIDANDFASKVIPAFNNIGFTVREPAGSTSLNHPIAIDFCAARGAGYGKEKILHKRGSDHKALRYTWDMDDDSVAFPYGTPVPPGE